MLESKNLTLFARYAPLEAYSLSTIDCAPLEFCHTSEGELNIIDRSKTHPFYYHAQEGARWEAQEWAKTLSLESTDVLFVYGLGLGYYYEAIQEWLHANNNRHLVFIEEDPRIVRRFLQTSQATKILKDLQVTVALLPCLQQRSTLPSEGFWSAVRTAAAPFIWPFTQATARISALQSYFFHYFDFFHHLASQWLMQMTRAKMRIREFLPNPSPVCQNLYGNLPHLSNAARGEALFGKFHSVPAIICGAGPSLEKQLPLLKKINNKALIFASGSAVNAVTRAGITPHLAGGIDPTPTQASRQLTSFAFELPIFYCHRYYAPALDWWHGPRLFIPGGSAFPLFGWFEHMLGVNGEEIISGISTTNFLLEIAQLLGCNPIIMVGLDLAYTEGKRYATGVSAHASDLEIEHKKLTYQEKALMAVASSDGSKVYTKYEWLFESACITAFQQRNPHITFLNATEGGMMIPSVPNIPFQQAVDDYLHNSWELAGWLHAEIQNASVDPLDSQMILEVMECWKASLERCLAIVLKQSEELRAFGIHPMSIWQAALEEEPAYTQLIETLNVVFDTLHKLRIHRLQRQQPSKKRNGAYLKLEKERLRFLTNHLRSHLQALQAGVAAYQKNVNVQQHTVSGALDRPAPISINLKGQKIVTHVSPKGILLAESTLVNGKLEGRSTYYYASGALYALLHHHNGIPHGEHLYYYPNGLPKSIIPYKNGLLDGVVMLYHPNGKIKKIQSFSKGKLHGTEKMWDIEGHLTLHACYENNSRNGSSKWKSDAKF